MGTTEGSLAEIRKLGGRVELAEPIPAGSAVAIDFTGQAIRDADLEQLAGVPQLQKLNLSVHPGHGCRAGASAGPDRIAGVEPFQCRTSLTRAWDTSTGLCTTYGSSTSIVCRSPTSAWSTSKG